MWDLNKVVPLPNNGRDLATHHAEPAPVVHTHSMGEDRMRAAGAGLNLDTSRMRFEPDGQIRRCPEVGHGNGDDAGWYVAREFKGVLYGTVGNWRSGDMTHWCSRDEESLTEEFREERRRRQEADKATVAEIKRQAGMKVAAALQGLPPADPSHPYLVRKGVKPHGLLQDGDHLVVPVCDIDGNVISRQTISPDGKKLFAYNCASAGMYVIGGPTDHVVICEGFATGASIHEMVGCRVYVAFNAGNLPKLVEDIAQREGRKIWIAADNDESGAGQKFAAEAAGLVNGEVLLPREPGTDWNDVALTEPRELRVRFERLKPLLVETDWGIDLRTLPKREFLYGIQYIRRYVSLTSAPPGVGKSTLISAEIVAMATGRNLLGVQPDRPLRVMYYNAEDGVDEMMRRICAVCDYHRIPRQALAGQLFIRSGRDFDLRMLVQDGRAIVPVQHHYDALERALFQNQIDVLVLDPIANMHSCEETNEALLQFTKPLLGIAEHCNTAVSLVHHTRKLNKGRATVEDSRGGSSLIGAVRAARVLNEMTEAQAEMWGVDASEFIIIDRKQKNNLAPSPPHDVFLRKVSVCLEDDTQVVVPELWKPPSQDADVTREVVAEIQRRVAASEFEPRLAAQAGDKWVGAIIADALRLDLEEPADRKKVKRLLARWLESGVLVEAEGERGANGRQARVVAAGVSIMTETRA